LPRWRQRALSSRESRNEFFLPSESETFGGQPQELPGVVIAKVAAGLLLITLVRMISARWTACAGALLLATLTTGCTNELEGTAKITSKALGDHTIKPTECVSGERQGFFGADLREGGADDKTLRVINDPKEGYAVKVNIPGTKKAVLLSESRCETFDVSVEKQNSEINDIQNVRGRVKIACTVDDDKISADLKFANCH
jgi:hypothetical protein